MLNAISARSLSDDACHVEHRNLCRAIWRRCEGHLYFALRSRCIEFSGSYPHGSYPPPHLNGLASYWRSCGFSAKIGHPQSHGGAVCHRKVISSTKTPPLAARAAQPSRCLYSVSCLHPSNLFDSIAETRAARITLSIQDFQALSSDSCKSCVGATAVKGSKIA